MTTALHDTRLAEVLAAVAEVRPRRVADLGAGEGALLGALAGLAGVERVVALDPSRRALEVARARLGAAARARAVFVAGSALDLGRELAPVDVAVLVEVIEHLPEGETPALARAVLGRLRPARAIVTTPNAEMNPLLGVPVHRLRHPDHRFEWDRVTFRAWAARAAAAHGYGVVHRDICGLHPVLGGASQMAVFDRAGE